jgi:GntR family transcriptional regulator
VSRNKLDNIQLTPIFSARQSEPLPNRVAASIRQALRDGQLKPGAQLPSEPDLAQQLGVSRTTLRDAVRMLILDGSLERRRGVGTFITRNPLINIQEGLETLISTTDVIRGQGYESGTAASRVETLPASPEMAAVFEIAAGTPLIHFSRTRTANGTPVIQCEEFLPTTILPPESIGDLDGDWSLYRFLRQSRLEITSAICRVIPVVADKNLAACLKVPLRHPLQLLRQIHFANGQQPVLYCENYHNSSMIEFHVLRRA